MVNESGQVLLLLSLIAIGREIGQEVQVSRVFVIGYPPQIAWCLRFYCSCLPSILLSYCSTVYVGYVAVVLAKLVIATSRVRLLFIASGTRVR